jgi:hypothetical protein
MCFVKAGLIAGVVAFTAVGCTARSPSPRDGMTPEEQTGGRGGGGWTMPPQPGGAGVGGAGAGGAGTGAGGAGAGTGGFAGTGAGGSTMVPACPDVPPLPDVLACAHGDALLDRGDGFVFMDDMAGTVSVHTPPPRIDCAEPGGALFGASNGSDQVYVVSDDNTEVTLSLRSLGGRPLLSEGQKVWVEYEAWNLPNLPKTGMLGVRDEAGEVLYWLARSNAGPEKLPLPLDVSVFGLEVRAGRHVLANLGARRRPVAATPRLHRELHRDLAGCVQHHRGLPRDLRVPRGRERDLVHRVRRGRLLQRRRRGDLRDQRRDRRARVVYHDVRPARLVALRGRRLHPRPGYRRRALTANQ